jgi:hypothetical protein
MAVAMVVAPELFSRENLENALENIKAHLVGPLGRDDDY